MKAILWTAYGPPDVLQLAEVEKPTPKDHEVLVKVHATTVTAGDCEMRSLKLPLMLSLPMRLYVGPRRPTRVKMIGQELAGEIEAVGDEVTRFKPGDQVFAGSGFGRGTYAEYVCLPAEPPEVALAIKPVNMTYEEAATVPTGGLEALHFLRKGEIQRGQHLLINGAGGSIGTYAIQLAKHFGAEVTAVDSAEKLEMLRALGADHVIDYRQEDFSQRREAYDVVFDVVGKRSMLRSIRALKSNGRYLLANPKLSSIIQRLVVAMTSSKTVLMSPSSQSYQDLVFLRDLIEAGHLKSVIDRRYPLEQTAEAHRYVETGRKSGHVVITVHGSSQT